MTRKEFLGAYNIGYRDGKAEEYHPTDYDDVFDIEQEPTDEYKRGYDKGFDEGAEYGIKATVEPCEGCVSRQAVNILVDELARAISDERCCMPRGRSTASIMQDILDLPSVQPKTEQEPCDDAVSREAVLSLFDKTTFVSWDLTWLERRIKALPSVTQKSGKWDRLYSWLNDMRLGIAPDETVTDIDERHCREAQTDILDEIMEWMIKAESEE